jgi:hypothetical protein
MQVGRQQGQRLSVLRHTRQGLPVVCLLKQGETEVNMKNLYFDFGAFIFLGPLLLPELLL